MNIKTKINKAMVKAKRYGYKFNTILLGKEEREEIKYLNDQLEHEEIEIAKNAGSEFNIHIVYVDEDSFFEAVYIVDEEKGKKKDELVYEAVRIVDEEKGKEKDELV